MKLTDLKLNPDNPRFIRDERFAKLVKSISEFPKMMELRPIIIDSDNMILAGNMRYRALLELKFKDISDKWVKNANELTEDEKRRFIIADNIGFGENDWDILANSRNEEELKDWGLDLPVDWGVEEIEAKEDDYVIPDEIKTDIVLGDLFDIGEHRLLCGDSTDSKQVAKLMGGGKADMVYCDPPYGMKLDTDFSVMGDFMKQKKSSKKKAVSKNYDKVIGDNDDFNPRFITIIFDVFGYCKEIFLFGADYYSELIPGIKSGSWIVWDKRAGIEDVDYTLSEFELCWSKQRHHRKIARFVWFGMIGLQFKDGENHSGSSKRVHPNQKPTSMYKWFFENWGKDNDLIVDLFLGSGSTMVASDQLNRKCYGMEIDPKYCQIIIDRMKKLNPDIIIKKNGKKIVVKV